MGMGIPRFPIRGEPCLNDGTYILHEDPIWCTCPPTFWGQFCEKDVNECAFSSLVCRTKESCVNLYGGYECDGVPMMTKPKCDTWGSYIDSKCINAPAVLAVLFCYVAATILLSLVWTGIRLRKKIAIRKKAQETKKDIERRLKMLVV